MEDFFKVIFFKNVNVNNAMKLYTDLMATMANFYMVYHNKRKGKIYQKVFKMWLWTLWWSCEVIAMPADKESWLQQCFLCKLFDGHFHNA